MKTIPSPCPICSGHECTQCNFEGTIYVPQHVDDSTTVVLPDEEEIDFTWIEEAERKAAEELSEM